MDGLESSFPVQLVRASFSMCGHQKQVRSLDLFAFHCCVDALLCQSGGIDDLESRKVLEALRALFGTSREWVDHAVDRAKTNTRDMREAGGPVDDWNFSDLDGEELFQYEAVLEAKESRQGEHPVCLKCCADDFEAALQRLEAEQDRAMLGRCPGLSEDHREDDRLLPDLLAPSASAEEHGALSLIPGNRDAGDPLCLKCCADDFEAVLQGPQAEQDCALPGPSPDLFEDGRNDRLLPDLLAPSPAVTSVDECASPTIAGGKEAGKHLCVKCCADDFEAALQRLEAEQDRAVPRLSPLLDCEDRAREDDRLLPDLVAPSPTAVFDEFASLSPDRGREREVGLLSPTYAEWPWLSPPSDCDI
eukprot:g47115.t1